jgi:transcriptional regulator with XRE-family HTH domain
MALMMSEMVMIETSVHEPCFFSTTEIHKLFLHAEARRNYAYSMDISTEIGRRIKAARKGKNWSQQDLSAHCQGMSKSRISNYEQGTRRPGVEEAKELASALGVSAAFLLCLEDDGAVTDTEKALLNAYRTADERVRDMIMGIAESQSVYTSENPGRRKAS